MFAQKFSRNKVELHVRCLSLSPTPLSVSLTLLFQLRLSLCAAKWGKNTQQLWGENYKPFFSSLLFCISYASA